LSEGAVGSIVTVVYVSRDELSPNRYRGNETLLSVGKICGKNSFSTTNAMLKMKIMKTNETSGAVDVTINITISNIIRAKNKPTFHIIQTFYFYSNYSKSIITHK
jgi:hypothetical protein